MNKYGIKSTINHEAHEGYEEKTKSINVLNLHALHELHGYFFYIEYFHSLVPYMPNPLPSQPIFGVMLIFHFYGIIRANSFTLD